MATKQRLKQRLQEKLKNQKKCNCSFAEVCNIQELVSFKTIFKALNTFVHLTSLCDVHHGTRLETLRLYVKFFINAVQTQPQLEHALIVCVGIIIEEDDIHFENDYLMRFAISTHMATVLVSFGCLIEHAPVHIRDELARTDAMNKNLQEFILTYDVD